MLARAVLVGSLLASLGACGGPPAPRPAGATPTAATVAAPPALPPLAEPSPPSASTGPQESPGFADALASLRPDAARPTLDALAAAPSTPEPYAQAALAYSTTNAAGMTLLWGMTYQAMGGGASDADIARALSKVLVERIEAAPAENGKDVNFSLRLAPGQMPARQNPDGSVESPLLHVFEALFGPAVVGFRPPWTIEQFHDAISVWAGLVSAHGTPLDEKLELNRWLVATAKAGHLEAFCHQLLGAAHPAELKAYKAHGAVALKAYRAYLGDSALKPTRGAMPDELVRVQ